jgi:enoyl reductase-like protein
MAGNSGGISTQTGEADDGYTTLTLHPEETMNARELAQALRHIAEELGGGGDVTEAVDALHELAEELDPGSGALLEAYYLEDDDGDDGKA